MGARIKRLIVKPTYVGITGKCKPIYGQAYCLTHACRNNRMVGNLELIHLHGEPTHTGITESKNKSFIRHNAECAFFVSLSIRSKRFTSSPEQDASYIFSFQQVSFIPDPG